MPAADTVYTALWTINSYDLTYDANGGTGGIAATPTVYNTALSAPTVSREGYTFDRWDPAVAATMPAADTVYTAQWTINSYSVYFDSVGGSAVDTINQVYGTPVTAPADPTKTGYTFNGWLPAVPDNMPGSDTFCVAQWTINSYDLTYNANGGTGGIAATQTVFGSALSAPTVAREGYTFDGWLPPVAATMPAANTVYTAHWTINNYDLTYDANGGTGGIAKTSTEYNTPLSAPTVTRTGYTFDGWLPAVPATMPAVNTVYTAQWKIISYTITFDAAGGTGGTAPLVEYGTIPTPPIVVKTGYTFERWDPEIVEATAEATYIAIWSLDKVQITFDANGGTNGSSFAILPGEPLSAPSTTREGYIFNGWSPTVPSTVPGTSTTYTAQWIKTEVTVTKLETGMKINIQGWTADTKYQIWTYQKVTSDDLLNTTLDVPANQWILSQVYTAGSAGELDLGNGGINFFIADFVSPDRNYTIAVRMADAGNNFLGEIRNAYTPEEIGQVIITKTLVDDVFSTGSEIKEIASGSQVLLKVICNDVPSIAYTAIVRGGATELDLAASNTNEFVWDTSALTPGMYTVEITATNGTTTDKQTISFRMYTLDAGVNYGTIDAMAVTTGAGMVDITPTYDYGTFSYRVREPGRAAIYRSTEYATNPGTIEYPMTAYGIYHVYGYVTRAGITGTESSYDDGIIKMVNIKRSQTEPSSTTLTADKNLSVPISTGTNIHFESTASIGGIGTTPVQYSFWRYDAKGFALVKDWSSDNTLNWTPARVGVYTIEVRAKGEDAGSYEAIKTVKVTVIGEKQIAQGVVITLLNQADLIANAQARKPITIKASATSTNSQDLLYKFYAYDADMLVVQLQGYSVNQNCVWIPRKAGDYKIMVLVKNMSSFGQFDAIESYDITVK